MREVHLADLLTFTRDGEWGNGEPTEGFSPALVVRGTDFERVRAGDLGTLPLRYIRSDILARKSIIAGDTLIETAGGTKDQPTGRSVFIPTSIVDAAKLPMVCASFARFLRPDPNLVDPQFLFWKLQDEYHSRRMMPYHVQHTGVARFQYTQFAENHPLTLPTIPEQRSIAATLRALDDKIELNRKMNATLEAMARALFRDWFVDFGPTRAKMEGREPYLSPDLWALFPDRLDDEGKPEGWDEKPLDEVALFLNGLALQKFPGEGETDSLPVIKIAELRNGISEKSNRASLKVPPQYVINDGDFLFSWSGSLLAKFWTGGKGALNQHLFKVTSDRYPAWFYSEWVQHHLEEFQIIAASKATTMGHIQRGHLKAAMTICPPDHVIEQMGLIIAPMFDQIIHNDLESRTLAQTRDLLLPRLMSGELRVADLATTLGEAAA